MANSPIIYGGSNNQGKTLLPPATSGAQTVDTSGNIGNIGIATANGLATLDPSGKIPSSQLPSTLLEYQGQWNPSTNTPILQDSTGVNAQVYQVSTAFAGPIAGLANPTMVNFQVGNLVIFSSTLSQWEQTDAVTGVVSVNGAQGAVTVNAINQLTGDVTAGPATGSQSVTASLVATSNSTLVTLSSLSLPGSQVTGNISGNAANILATTNSTLITLSALSLPYSQITGTPAIGANTALSNLITTSINQDLLPNAAGSYTIGSNSLYWAQSFFNGVSISTGGLSTLLNTDLFLFTTDQSTLASGNVVLKSGNTIASGLNSGNVTIQTGTVSGGTRGNIQLKNGSEGTLGYVWTSTDTSGSGSWLALASGTKNYLTRYVASTSGGVANPGNGDFEANSTTGWSSWQYSDHYKWFASKHIANIWFRFKF